MKTTLLVVTLAALVLLAPAPFGGMETARADHCEPADPDDYVAALFCCVVNKPEGTPCRIPQ